MVFLHELEELAFAHDGVGDVEAGKFDLLGAVEVELGENPFVEGAVYFKLECAEGVGDAFDGVFDAVGEVVHGVDAVAVAGVVVGGVFDAIDGGIAEMEVGGGHVDFGAENIGAVGVVSVAHLVEEVEVFLNGAVASGGFLTGLCGDAAVGFEGFLGEVADVGVALFDELAGVGFHLVEVGGGPVEVFAPVVAEPADVFLDGVDILFVFGFGVGVVES